MPFVTHLQRYESGVRIKWIPTRHRIEISCHVERVGTNVAEMDLEDLFDQLHIQPEDCRKAFNRLYAGIPLPKK
jgi:hypothetical protein